jgi:hypothetical protein
MKLIPDNIINFSKEPDLLGHTSYVDTLTTLISDCATPLTIGLYGEWGAGKSSIIETILSKLEEKSKDDIRAVIYDSWKYSNDSFRRTFLIQFISAFGIKQKRNLKDIFYNERTEDQKPNTEIHWGYVILFLLISSVLLYLSSLADKSVSAIIQSSTVLLIISSATLLKNMFFEMRTTVKFSTLSTPEQFEEIFRETIRSCTRGGESSAHDYEYVYPKKEKRRVGKIVVIFDNLDRCTPDRVYETLSAIKGFIAGNENVVVIIPVDEKALRRHLVNVFSYAKENQSDADEFLRKLVNISLTIRALGSSDLHVFAREISTRYGHNFLPDTLDVLAKEYASNPRRIIQALNNLIVELDYFHKCEGKEFTNSNESLIAALAVIKAEWPNAFKKYLNNPTLLLQSVTADFADGDDRFASYIPAVSGVFAAADINTLDRILRIRNTTQELPVVLIEAINKRDAETIKVALTNDPNTIDKILTYLLTEFDKAVRRGSLRVGAVDALQKLVFIESNWPANRNDLRRIYSRVSNTVVLTQILEYCSEPKDALSLIQKLASNGFIKPLEEAYRLIGSHYQSTDISADKLAMPKRWQDYLLSALSIADKSQDLAILAHAFEVQFFVGKEIGLGDYVSNKNTATYLLTESFMDTLLLRITAKRDGWNQDFISAVQTGLVKSNTLNAYFATRAKYLWTQNPVLESEISEELDNALEILKSCKKSLYTADSAELKQLLDGYFQSRQWKRSANQLVTSVPAQVMCSGKDYRLLDCLKEVYRVTGNRVDQIGRMETCANWANDLSKMTDAVYEIVVDDEFNGTGFDPYLIKRAPANLKLIETVITILTKRDSEEKRFNPDELDTFIVRVLTENMTFANGEGSDALIRLMKSRRVKKRLDSIARLLSDDQIRALPNAVKRLLFDYLSKGDKIFDFEDDLALLSDMLEENQALYTQAVGKVIVKKLLTAEHAMDAVGLLEKCETFDTKFANQILPLLQEDSFKDEDQKRIKALIKRIRA